LQWKPALTMLPPRREYMPTRNTPHDPTSTVQKKNTSEDTIASYEEIAIALGEHPPTPVQTLLSHARRVNYAQHDTLYHQGNRIDTVFFITAGLLKLVAYLPNGRARIVRLHRPGSVLGLSGLRGHNNEHTASAITAVSALRLPISAVHHLREDDPESYVSLIERWHDYLQDADKWIVQFSTGPIRGRVARLLSFLQDFEPDAAEGRIRLLTCEEMASILGVTSESVSRILADFKRQHILSHDNENSSEVYEADVERLRHIAEENE
jgi:CRP/FNR family transcriptional regulator, anaerobic regulatory protein